MDDSSQTRITAPLKMDDIFSTAQFDDPIARQTSWEPIKGTGANFRTRRLVKAGLGRIEFRATPLVHLLYLLLILAGPLAATVFYFPLRPFGYLVAIPIAVGALISILGLWFYWRATRPLVFDRNCGFFWKGGGEAPKGGPGGDCARLEDIYAVQVVSDYMRSAESSFYTYELNLIKDSTKRIYLLDHGNQALLREDAKALAMFLDVKLWDVT